MEKLLSEMKMVDKYNRTIRKEDLDIKRKHTITGMKCVTTKYGKNSLLLLILKARKKIIWIFRPYI